MICLIHIDESAIYVLIVARLSRLYVPFSKKFDSLLDRLDNWCMMCGSRSDTPLGGSSDGDEVGSS
jgi:hypothetical protein